jgi:asparagine synthase (glutamine-hydrolysing)
MCGIFIVIAKKKILNKSKCMRSVRVLYNRGPDILKYNFYNKKKLFISNTVLSITGQPINSKQLNLSSNKRFVVSFNGEIYNYKHLLNKFLKKNLLNKDFTDTQVLANLHDVLEKDKIPKLLNGMFAYSVYDNKDKSLVFYNDPQGEKSAYYFSDENYFIISSTIEAILKFIKKNSINFATLKKYFYTRHYMPLENTSFKNIKLIRNGCKLNYDIKKNIFSITSYDSPFNWVSKKKYNFFKSLKEREVIKYFEKSLVKQLKLMIPKIDFGCVSSGGIDSTLQSVLISKILKPKINLAINHVGKDKILDSISNFNNYLNPPITIINLDAKTYIKNILESYKITSSPLHTHDLGGRLEVAKTFKNNNCKVFFSADGCDELFGGQQLYYRLFYKLKNYKKNISPYSTANNLETLEQDEKITEYKNLLQEYWLKINNQYNFLKLKERNIQSSLFLDYFIQSVNVANRSNDLISSNYSIEPRNVYIQKNILKIIINLPLKYKINFKNNVKNLQQKYLLKKIFARHLSKKLIFKKEGFSGFPNSMSKFLKKSNFLMIEKLLDIDINKHNYYYDKKNYKRDRDWKIINVSLFLKEFNKK